MNIDIKMVEQIYKDLYKNDEGKYMFATNEDTRLVVSQEAYLLIYVLELLLDKKETEIFLSNEKGGETKNG